MMHKILVTHIGGYGLGDGITMLPRRLKRKGFDVVNFVDGEANDANFEQVVAKVHQECPDLIIMYIGINYPDFYKNAQEAIKRIKTKEITRNTPILILTPRESDEEIEAVNKIDCDGHIAKFPKNIIENYDKRKEYNILDHNIVPKINELLNNHRKE